MILPDETPEPITERFEALHKAVKHLHIRWQLYRELFAANQDDIDLLNRTAPTFFGECEWIWRQEIFLGLCRLTDPAQLGQFKNLSFEALILSLYNFGGDGGQLKALEDRYQEVKLSVAFAGKYRNQLLAHADLETALNINHVRPLPEVSRNDIENALKAIRSFMNEFSVVFADTTIIYSNIKIGGGGTALLRTLQKIDLPE